MPGPNGNSDTSLLTLQILFIAVPGLLLALTAWVLKNYPLTAARHNEIRKALDAATVNTIAMPLIGGTSSWLGPVIGAFAMVLLENWFQDMMERWLLLMGAFVVAVGLFLPHGLAGLLRRKPA